MPNNETKKGVISEADRNLAISIGLTDTRPFQGRLEPSDMVSDLSASESRPRLRTENNFQKNVSYEIRGRLTGRVKKQFSRMLADAKSQALHAVLDGWLVEARLLTWARVRTKDSLICF